MEHLYLHPLILINYVHKKKQLSFAIYLRIPTIIYILYFTIFFHIEKKRKQINSEKIWQRKIILIIFISEKQQQQYKNKTNNFTHHHNKKLLYHKYGVKTRGTSTAI